MCRGVLMLDSDRGEIVDFYNVASRNCSVLRGVVAGQSILAQPLLDWSTGKSDNSTLARELEAGIDSLVATWPGSER